MAFRPPTVPRFATAAAAGRIVEPIEAVRAAGYADGDRPPASWENWDKNLTGAWIDFLRGPGLANLKRTEIASPNFVLAAVDDISSDAGLSAPNRRIVATDDSNGAHLWASVSADDFTQIAVTPVSGTLGAPRAIIMDGAHWVLACYDAGASVARLWSTPVGGGAVYDPAGVHWNAVTLPGSPTEIDALAAKRDPATGLPLDLVAVSVAGIYYATSLSGTLAFAAATLVGSPATYTGVGFVDVLWTGTRWVAVNVDGEVWSCATAGGTWTRTAVLTSTPPYVWLLASDGLGNVVAYPRSTTVDNWWVSTDGGASWASQAGPPGITQIYRVRYVQGAWLLTSSRPPYLASANAPATGAWLGLPVPYPETGTPGRTLTDVVYADGAVVALGQAFWLRSTRAADVAPGAYTPGTAPLLLHDAAYLRGNLVENTAPTDGQALVWSAADGAWKPGAAGLSNALATSFPLALGAHDYTADANFTLSGFSAGASTGAFKGSDVLGDGVDAPRFYALWRSSVGAINALARTAGGALRLQPSDALAAADAWPFASTSCAVVIPLPAADEIQLDATLLANFGAISGGDSARVFMAVGGLIGAGSLFCDAAAGFVWDASTHAVDDEYVGPGDISRSTVTPTATVGSFLTGAVAQRRFRILLRGAAVQVLGAPTSGPLGTPSVALLQRWDTATRPLGVRRYLVLGVAGSSPTTKGLFGEISNLAINGIRSYL